METHPISTEHNAVWCLCSEVCHSTVAGFPACSMYIISPSASSERDISRPRRWTLPSAMQMWLMQPWATAAAATHPGTCHTDFGTCNPVCLGALGTPFLPVASARSLAADSQTPRTCNSSRCSSCSKSDCACLYLPSIMGKMEKWMLSLLMGG